MTHPPGLGARLAAFITRFPGLIVAVALVVGVLSFQGARRLGINQELRAMLPDHAATVVRLDEVSARLGNQSDLYVAVRSPSRAANVAFGEKIAAALRQRDDIRYVLFHRDPAFFKDNALLYAKLGDLLGLRRKVIDTIQAQIRREMSAFPEDIPAGSDDLGLDEKELRRKYNLADDPPEYFESDEGRVVVVRARPLRPNTDIAFSRNLFAGVNAAIAAADPAAHHPQMDVAIEGSYALHTRLASDLQSDIVNGSLAAFGMLLLIVSVYFRGLRSVPLVLTPLLIAASFALACAAWLYGYLNLVSAFIFAVQLGLGIDFGTHMLARYRDELARGLAHREAIGTAIATTGVSTAGGALSTALSFLLLVMAEFRGFTQFGVVACVGIVVAYLAAIIVLPALVVLFDRVWPWKVRPKPPAGSFTRHDPRPVPRLALAVMALVLAGGAFGASRLASIEFEYDLNKLGVPESETPEQRKRRLDFRSAVGKIQSTDPALAITADLEQTRELHRQLQALQEWKPSEVAALTGLPPLSPDPEPDPAEPAAKKPDPPQPADEDEEDEDDTEPDDPKFVAMQALADANAVVAPETRAALLAYGPERLREMDDLLNSVLSIHSFIPDLQAEKLAVIKDIKQRLDRKRGSMSDADADKLRTWDRYLDVDRPVDVADLPEWVRVQFTDTEGQVGRFVAFWHNGATADYNHSKRIFANFYTLTARAGEVPVVANYYVIPEIVDTIRGDGPLVMAAVFGVLVVTALVMFRSLAHTLLVLATVALALLGLAALFPALGWKLNLFNLIALPLLVGMGQDDSLHLVHRYREEGPGSLRFVLRETGGAVFLTTLTTVIGFSSMLFVSHQGLRSLGWTACLGMVLCLVSSVLVVPSGLRILEWLRHRRDAAWTPAPPPATDA
ncbi:MAG: MMPL family transporter [Myxococcales bacterium]|nr:MMPL family transporter [Myxococcales bacterium]